MLNRKKMFAVFLVLAFILQMNGCKKAEDVETDTDAVTPTVTEAPTVAPTNTPTPTLEPAGASFTDVSSMEKGTVIDFEDGQYGFIQLNTAPGNADESELSIVDYGGSKVLKVDVKNDKIPYVAIDVASLVKDRIADVRSIEMDIGVEYEDGEFRACSGLVYAYSGTERTESSDPWSVYLEKKNPNVAKGVLDDEAEYFVPDAQNFFVVTKETDNGLSAGTAAADLYIDNIIIRDADGNPIPVDTSAGFDKPAGFGAADLTNLTGVVAESTIEGAEGKTDGGWGQAVVIGALKNEGGTFDPSVLQPGCIITVYFSSASAPELILQSWTEGAYETSGWAKVAPFTVNDSCTIAQYSYDDMVAAFGGDDFATYLDNFNVGDTGNAISVSKVTVGMPAGEEVVIEGGEGESDGSWGQAVMLATVKDGGTFDPSMLKSGCMISVTYTSDICPEVVLQSWTEGAPDTAGWAKVAACADTGEVATYSVDDMIAAFGSDDFAGLLDNFIVGDCGAALKVTKITIQ